MPQELKGHVCDKMRPISRERHVSRGHLVRIVHEHKQHTAEQNRKPFPFYERKKPRLDVSAEADFLAQADNNKEIENVCSKFLQRQQLRVRENTGYNLGYQQEENPNDTGHDQRRFEIPFTETERRCPAADQDRN